jgi:methionine-gamma-lyase
MTSTYAFETAETGSELFRGERAGYIYGRTRNPTQALLEGRLGGPRGRRSAQTGRRRFPRQGSSIAHGPMAK